MHVHVLNAPTYTIPIIYYVYDTKYLLEYRLMEFHSLTPSTPPTTHLCTTIHSLSCEVILAIKDSLWYVHTAYYVDVYIYTLEFGMFM